MSTYIFPAFNLEIVDPTISVSRVNDDVINKTANVEVLLVVDGVRKIVTLSGFTYVDTWEDSDVESWVAIEIQKYLK